MSFFRAVIHLLMQRRIDLYIAYRGLAGSQLKKIPAITTLLLTMIPEVITSEDIRHMRGDDLPDMDYSLNEDDPFKKDSGEEGFYIF